MSIELTKKQQYFLDHRSERPLRVVDPRTQTFYVLVPESEYRAMRELLEEERCEKAMHELALQNAAERLK